MCTALVVAPVGICCPSYIDAMRSCAVQVTVTTPEGRPFYINGKPVGTYDREVWLTQEEILVFSPPPLGVSEPVKEAKPQKKLSRSALSLDELGLAVASCR